MQPAAGGLQGSPWATTPPCSPEVVVAASGREEACAALEYAVLSGDRRQLAGRFADGGGVVLDAAAASYTRINPRGEVAVHRVPFACSKHVPQLRLVLDLYNSLVDRPLLCVRQLLSYLPYPVSPVPELPVFVPPDSVRWSHGYGPRASLRCAHVYSARCNRTHTWRSVR